jgi:hypothetical protein
MKMPVDKSWALLLVFVVTYAIALGVLLIARKSGETVTMPQTPTMPAGPRKPSSQGLPAPGNRARQMDPAQRDSG